MTKKNQPLNDESNNDESNLKPTEITDASERTPIEIIIDENAKNVNLTFEQLRETRTFADAHGFMPKLFPIEHHVFIQKLMDMANEINANPEVFKIIAAVKGIERISQTEAESKGLNQNAAENTRVKVLIGQINLGNAFTRKLWNLAIGFMYNEKGIEICIGTNISICGNFTIYGEAKHFCNYGRNGLELSEIFVHVETWLSKLADIDLVNSALLERMIIVSIEKESGTNEFLGRCLKEAVRKNYFYGKFPLTMSQVNRMASYFIDHEAEANDPEYKFSLYDTYNAGTYVLTHNDDLPNMFSNIKKFTHWFEEIYLPNNLELSE